MLTGDNYPHRIPMRNDEERLNVYNESGEDGLRGYLGTPKEIDFDRINKELSEFKEGKDIIEIKHMGRQDGDISYDETDLQELRCSSWSGPTEEANTLRVLIYLYFWRVRLRRLRRAALREDVTKTPQALSYAAW